MAAPTILLIEVLDGLGAHEADVALRVRALRSAGLAVRTLVHGPADGVSPAVAWRETAARITGGRPSAVWIAGAWRSWSALTRELPPGLPRVWWPTVVPGSGGEPSAPDGAAGRPVVAGADPGTLALDLAPVRDLRDRAPVALWDGDFVLVPGPLGGSEGASMLRAFATAAAGRPELELVVLAEPQADLIAAARALGIGWRVHFAGPAPREAEHAWLATAAAVLLPAHQPVSAGLVLRTLASGTPLVVEPAGSVARALTSWLAARGMPVTQTPGEALEAALAREPGVRDACARGRALAAHHAPEALAARLTAMRRRVDGDAREAA